MSRTCLGQQTIATEQVGKSKDEQNSMGQYWGRVFWMYHSGPSLFFALLASCVPQIFHRHNFCNSARYQLVFKALAMAYLNENRNKSSSSNNMLISKPFTGKWDCLSLTLAFLQHHISQTRLHFLKKQGHQGNSKDFLLVMLYLSDLCGYHVTWRLRKDKGSHTVLKSFKVVCTK